jgi:hypothetical protein
MNQYIMATRILPPMMFPNVTGMRFFIKKEPQVRLERSIL